MSRKGQSIRFTATDDAAADGPGDLRRHGMKFREDDELSCMVVVTRGSVVFVVTEGGYAKRTPVEEYRVQGRGGSASRSPSCPRSAATSSGRWWSRDDEVLVVMERGKVVRSARRRGPRHGPRHHGRALCRPGG